MKRAKSFIDALAADAPPTKRSRRKTPGDATEIPPTTEEQPEEYHDDLLDLEDAMDSLDDEEIWASMKVAPTPVPPKPKKNPAKKGRPTNSSCVEMHSGESLDDAGARVARELRLKVLHENTSSIGQVFPYIMPEDADAVYKKKKLAAFGITITLPVKVAGQFTGQALYASTAVKEAFEQVCDVFQVQDPVGRDTSDSKKQFRAFVKKVDGNPQYRKVEMKGRHVYDCIRKTRFYPAMEVQPGAQNLLHVQAHLEIYYFYDGFFLHVDSQELTRIFESMGYEWARVHVEFKTTQVYDSKQYIKIPPGKKTKDYWEKKSAWKEKAPVKLTKGTFNKAVYLEDENE